MTKAVWKFPVPLMGGDQHEIAMPKDAQILHLDAQRGVQCIWALVDEEAEKIRRKFFWAGTGHRIDPALKIAHVGTVFVDGGTFVFHLFEELTDV